MVTVPISETIKITLFYIYKAIKPIPTAPSTTIQQLLRFGPNTPFYLKAKSVLINTQGYSHFSLRVSKGSTVYETLE